MQIQNQTNNEVNAALAKAREICGEEAIIGFTDRGEFFVHDGKTNMSWSMWRGTHGGFRGLGGSWGEAIESARLHIAEGTFARLLFPALGEADPWNKVTPLRPN